jgi:hypothetical protein
MCTAADADAGVQVPRQDEGAGHGPRVVRKREAAPRQGLVEGLDVEQRGRVAGPVVVVASHQRQLQRAVQFPPAQHGHEGVGRERARRMQEVA